LIVIDFCPLWWGLVARTADLGSTKVQLPQCKVAALRKFQASKNDVDTEPSDL
jgi:hypothetical protein